MATVVYERTRQKPEGGVVTSRNSRVWGEPVKWRVEVDDEAVTTDAVGVRVHGEGLWAREWWATMEGLTWWKPWTWAARMDPGDPDEDGPLWPLAVSASIVAAILTTIFAAVHSAPLLVLIPVGPFWIWVFAALICYGWDRGLTRQIDHAVQTVDRIADRWEDRAARLHAMRQIAETEAEERREVQAALGEITATKETPR